MDRELEEKRNKIRQLDSRLGSKDSLMFHPPTDYSLLYSKEEVMQLLKPLYKIQIPPEYKNVQKSQFIKYEVLKHLGYKRPVGLRTTQAKAHKPKFIHQLMDIFLDKAGNYQPWGYIPYDDGVLEGDWNAKKLRYKDCRYLFIKRDSYGNIVNMMIKEGKELEKWDKTKKITIKMQATIPKSFWEKREIICGKQDPIFDKIKSYKAIDEKFRLIKELDNNRDEPLIKKRPNEETLYRINELKIKLNTILGEEIPKLESGQERIISQIIEKKIAKILGYNFTEQTDTGQYPDLIHQLIEIKGHFSPTIDLGKNHPTSNKVLDFDWNTYGFTNQQVRYCIIILSELTSSYKIETIVITSGKDFNQFFTICKGTPGKLQFSLKWDRDDLVINIKSKKRYGTTKITDFYEGQK